MTWEFAITEHEIASLRLGYYKDSSRVPGSKCWKGKSGYDKLHMPFTGPDSPLLSFQQPYCNYTRDVLGSINSTDAWNKKGVLCKWWQSCPMSISEHFPSPGGQENIVKSARSIANHACSRTPRQLSCAQSESRKWKLGSSKQGGNRGC